MQAFESSAQDQLPADIAQVQRIAAFSDGPQGGNPAGVWIGAALPEAAEMQRIAHAVGFSETAFAAPLDPASGQGGYRVRYFSPEAEVPFCGHATIALGAALAAANGDGVFALTLNDARITVEGRRKERAGEEADEEADAGAGEGAGNGARPAMTSAALQSPPTRSAPAPQEVVERALALFGYRQQDLDPRIPPALAHGGAGHLVLALRSRALLAAMRYDLDAGRVFMRELGIVTVVLAWADTGTLFHTRNPFAAGGVYEDPATGAGTAALAGYLRDIGWVRDWPHGGQIDVVQGEDMGMRSRLHAAFDSTPGGSIRVSGTARSME